MILYFHFVVAPASATVSVAVYDVPEGLITDRCDIMDVWSYLIDDGINTSSLAALC